MGVFANGLEISGKAVSAKTIAAMPDVCFTPPENPATPPGVPVPYPSFGMAGDTDKGTGTVKIGGKTVNIKNKSHLTKTTGTEAGSAAKKGIITSKNTGKEQFNSWSNDVKFDGEPVIRNTDMATNNHASPAGNTPPWMHVAKLAGSDTSCAKHNIKPYDQLDCPKGYDKEHTVEAQFLTVKGVRDKTLKCCESYEESKAPCICMKAQWVEEDKASVVGIPLKTSSGKTRTYTASKFEGKRTGTAHYYKSASCRNWLRNNPNGTLGDFKKTCLDSTKERIDPKPANIDDFIECLTLANNEYLKESMNKTQDEVDAVKKCHGTCGWAQDMAKKVVNLKAKLKRAAKAAGKDPTGVSVTAKDMATLRTSKKCP